MLCLTVVYLRDIANMTFSILNLNVNHLSICSSCWTTRMNDMRGPAIERDALGPTLAQNWAWLTSVSGWPSVKKEYPTPSLSWDFFFFFFDGWSWAVAAQKHTLMWSWVFMSGCGCVNLWSVHCVRHPWRWWNDVFCVPLMIHSTPPSFSATQVIERFYKMVRSTNASLPSDYDSPRQGEKLSRIALPGICFCRWVCLFVCLSCWLEIILSDVVIDWHEKCEYIMISVGPSRWLSGMAHKLLTLPFSQTLYVWWMSSFAGWYYLLSFTCSYGITHWALPVHITFSDLVRVSGHSSVEQFQLKILCFIQLSWNFVEMLCM